MTTYTRTTHPNLANSPNSTADVFEALKGFYSAMEDLDLFRANSWFRHLEFINDIQYLQRIGE
jgi:hypothetical protein